MTGNKREECYRPIINATTCPPSILVPCMLFICSRHFNICFGLECVCFQRIQIDLILIFHLGERLEKSHKRKVVKLIYVNKVYKVYIWHGYNMESY